MTNKHPKLILNSDHICGRFSAMASPCEILFDCIDINSVAALFDKAVLETKRIEKKFSRYINANMLFDINHSNGKPIEIDSETHSLLCFADTCYNISNGKFDVTSGVLRKVWKFDGSDNVPNKQQVNDLMPFIGWSQVHYDENEVRLPRGFEIDFGGIGKEYAVNKVAQLLNDAFPDISILVNFGGDIQVTRPRKHVPFWQVGIENPTNNNGIAVVNIAKGGLATSGDANRFLMKDGKRYSHILDPHTGFPVDGVARSITVASDHCIQAGLMATLALLKGKSAERFLKDEKIVNWCYR